MSNYLGDTTITGSTASGGSTTLDSTSHASKGNVLVNGLTILASTGTFSLANGKTLTISNTLSLVGTDATTMTFPTTSATLARTDAGNTFTGDTTFSNNVGIGIAPTTLFQLSGGASNIYVGNFFLMDNTAQAAGTGARIALGGRVDGTATQQAFGTISGLKLNSSSGDYSGYLAFSVRANGGTMDERMRITQVGNVKIGGTADRGTTEGTNQVVIFNGTAPVGTLANGASFYAASGEMRVMDAAGNSTLLSPHDKSDNSWIYHSVDSRTGKGLKIDVEKMFRFLNDKFGTDFIHEFEE